MNKYLKFLMLSGGLVGSIALTAFDTPKTQNNDLSSVYADIEKMKQALPNLSRINYKLNIDLDTIGETSEQTISEQNIEDNSLDKTLEENIDNDEINNSSEGNISFTTTDEIGNQTLLDNHETLYYLHQTLNQTNTEYENLKPH